MRLDRVFSEVIGVIESFDEEYKNRIPEKLYEWMKKNKSENYNPSYDKNIPLSRQNISKDSIAFLYNLHFSYWLDNEAEKEQLLSILKKEG